MKTTHTIHEATQANAREMLERLCWLLARMEFAGEEGMWVEYHRSDLYGTGHEMLANARKILETI